MAFFNRREFIKMAGCAYASLLLIPSCTSRGAIKYRVFTEEEAKCLMALSEQIIPADNDPGATDAGVIHFIDKQTTLRFPDDLKTFCEGVASLQALCKAHYGNRFENLGSNIQIDIMKKMEKNELPGDYWQETGQASFFNRVLDRTMQGFYGSPRHGGNKDYASYRMMKLDYPLLIGQNRYRNER